MTFAKPLLFTSFIVTIRAIASPSMIENFPCSQEDLPIQNDPMNL
jgi:hypothetical protein